MDKVSQLTSDRAPYGTVVALTPSSELETTNEPRGPVSPTFNCVLGSQAEVNTLVPPPQPVPVLKVRAAAAHSEGQPPGKIKSLRRQLAAMLPCQEDVDYLSDMSHGWWLIRQHMMLDLSNMPEHELQKPFDVLTVSKGHPMLIARLLLSVAICIQQLPPNIDPGRLRLKVPLREVKDKIITFVTSTVTSDDELTCSMEGIECFALQAIYQANAGSLRRAWLTYRKAVSVSQLLGIHRWTSKATQDTFSLAETNRQYIWYQIVQGVRHPEILSEFTLTLFRSAIYLLHLVFPQPRHQNPYHLTIASHGSHPRTSIINISARFPASSSHATKAIPFTLSQPHKKLTKSSNHLPKICRHPGGISPPAP